MKSPELEGRRDMTDALPKRAGRARLAWMVAIAADLLQIILLPAFAGGILSPAVDVLDAVVAIIMIALLGWHIAFLPTALAELVPALNLFPTWTAAVFFVTRTRGRDEIARRKELPPSAR